MSNPNRIPPAPVQSYRFSDEALAQGVVGLTVSFVGCPMAQQEMFDVERAIVLSGGGAPTVITCSDQYVVSDTLVCDELANTGTFSVCDNAIKQALDDHPQVLRVG